MKNKKIIEFGYGFSKANWIINQNKKLKQFDWQKQFLKLSGIPKKYWNKFSNIRIDKKGRVLADYKMNKEEKIIWSKILESKNK